MKRYFCCAVLFCLLLTACATVAQPPASTTVRQSNSTIQMPLCYQGDNVWEHKYEGVYCVYCGISRPRPTIDLSTSCTTTTVPTPCVPTTDPTTKPVTKPVTTVTTKPAMKPTSRPAQLTTTTGISAVVRVVSGDESIEPVGRVFVKKMYGNGKWPTMICPPFKFTDYTDSQIPAIRRSDAVQLQMEENVELAALWMQQSRSGEASYITLEQLSTLAPGNYYIGMTLVQKDKFVAGDWETTTYQLGFRLIIPAE